MNFKKWLNLIEVGTMSSTPTGGIGDIAQFKRPLFGGVIRRTWPDIDPFFSQNSKKKAQKGVKNI
jgi:hypothetical protein